MKTAKTWRRENTRDLASCAALFLLAALLHAGVLDGHWRWDDPQILLHALQYPLVADFTDPQVWQQFSPANLTPWLILSFELDLALYGPEPKGFYLHQVLAMAGACVAFFLCLRLWVPRPVAFCTALVFLLGAPVAVVLEQLMTRHYIEGLLFCLLSLWCFVQYLRTEESGEEGGRLWLWLLLSVLFYLLALTAKEIYAPLLVLLPFLPASRWRCRLRAALPHLGVALVYSIWRVYMLASVSGGYVALDGYLDDRLAGDVLGAFSGFPRLLFGDIWPLIVVVFSILLLTAGRLRTWFLVLLVAALVLLPLVPLVRTPGITSPDRYLLLAWAVLVFALGWSISRVSLLRTRAVRLSAMVALPVFALAAAVQAYSVGNGVKRIGAEFDVQARFIEGRDEAVAFLPSMHVLPSFWFVTGLAQIKDQAGDTAPQAVVDPLFLEENQRVFAYSAECQCMEEVTESVLALRAEVEARIDREAPLRMQYRYSGGEFSWTFGPYTDGAYHVVSDMIGVIPAPAASGSLRVTLPEDVPFYLRYTAPEGWVTYSSRQQIQHNAPVTSWHRP